MRLVVLVVLNVWVCAGRVIVFVNDQHWRLLLTYKFSIQPLLECSWIDIAVENDGGTIITINRQGWIADHEDLSHENLINRIYSGKNKNSDENFYLLKTTFPLEIQILKRIKFLSSCCLRLTDIKSELKCDAISSEETQSTTTSATNC